jgi:hypothetical protein
LLEIIKDIKEWVVLLAGMTIAIIFSSNLPWRAYLIWYPVILAIAVEKKMHFHHHFFLSWMYFVIYYLFELKRFFFFIFYFLKARYKCSLVVATFFYYISFPTATIHFHYNNMRWHSFE